MEKLIFFHGIPVEPKLLRQTTGVTDGVTIDPLNNRYFVHGIGWQHFDKPGQTKPFLDRPYLKYLKRTSVAAIEQKNQAKFQASLPKNLRGARVEQIQKADIVAMEKELKSQEKLRSANGRCVSYKEIDSNDLLWDDVDDYENGVHAKSMQSGMDGGEITIKDELDNAISKIEIDCTIHLSGVNENNRQKAADFVRAWKKRRLRDQKTPKSLIYIADSIDDNSIAHDSLVIVDDNGRHSLPVAALLSSLIKAGSTAKDPEDERRPFLPKPTNQNDARLLLRTLNHITLDGYAPLFDNLQIIVRKVGVVGKIEAETKAAQFSETARAFLDGAVWKPSAEKTKVAVSQAANPPLKAPTGVVQAEPAVRTHMIEAKPQVKVSPVPKVPEPARPKTSESVAQSRPKPPIADRLHQLMDMPDCDGRKIKFLIFLIETHLRLSQEGQTYIITCLQDEVESVKPLLPDFSKFLGLPTWLKVQNGNTHRELRPALRVLQPA